MRYVLMMMAMVVFAPAAKAAYKETMDPDGLTKNMKTDFGLVDDNAKSNQSDLLQKAINELSSQGGGRLIIPKGTYCFANVCLNSDVHLLIERDTVIKPYWPEGDKVVVFNLTKYAASKRDSKSLEGHIENVSIRGLGGSFIIDYSNRGRHAPGGIRAINCRQVRNFLLSDIYIKDSWTTYCAVIFTPARAKDAREWKVFRPTDGLVRNLKSTNSSSGYGLVQMHAGDTIHFENLSTTNGGVTFRLETGAGAENGGIDNITAKNIYCENGLSAALLGPHKSQNGVVVIDGVIAKSCATGVQMGPGFIEKRNLGNPNYKQGKFADGTTIKNVHVIFGTNAPIALKSLGSIPEEYLKDLRWEKSANNRLRGPSIAAVRDSTSDSWNPIIENVTSEGFKYNGGIVVRERTKRVNYREVLKGYPVLKEIPPDPKKKKSKEEKQPSGQ